VGVFNLSEWALRHRAIVVFLILLTLVTGALSFLRLNRLEDPNFESPVMTAVVAWPGATAKEVQDQVLNRIERELQTLESVDYVRSFARQGYGGITLWMKGGTKKKELDHAWYLARKKIGDVRHEFPEGVRGPFFNDEYSDVYSVLYALQAPDLSMAELNEHAELIKRELQAVPMVGKVNILGKQAERIYVELSTRRLAAMNLSPQVVFDALRQQNLLSPSGSVDTRDDRVFVRTTGLLGSVADVAAVPVTVNGKPLRLSSIATVKAGFEDPASFTVRHNGTPALAIGVTMVRSGNTLALGEALEARMASIRQGLPAGMQVEKYADQPKVVKESVWEFQRSFLEALVIVLAVSLLSLGWRTGIVVAASVPLVLGVVATVMYVMDWPLDRISLGALIIALGLLVDDAIIAVEMMVVKLEQGWDRVRAATFAYTSTAFPMLTGTLVAVAGFMPVGFAKSIAGEYAGGMFWIVGVSLLASWVVAVLFTPCLGVLLLPKSVSVRDPYDRPAYRRFRVLVGGVVQHRRKVVLGALLLFVLACGGMGLVQQQFFPIAARPELLVELRMREGSSIQGTETQVKRLEHVLKQDPQVQFFTAYTGAGTPRFYLSLLPELPNPGYAQFVVMTRSLDDREAVRKRLMDLFDREEAFPHVRGRVSRLDFGPPVGFPVQFRVVGADPDRVRAIAYQVRDVVRGSALVRDTQLDWNEQVRSLSVEIDQDKARLLGLSGSDISSVVQAVLSGTTATQVRRGEELVDVVVRATPGERLHLDQLGDIQLQGRNGMAVPLLQVARVHEGFEEPVFQRRNRAMVLTVRADLADGVQGPYAAGKIRPLLQPLADKLPPGYAIEVGGAVEESDKANNALFAVIPIMLLVTMSLLMLQLQSFSRMLMVFLTAPLGLIGVVPALLVFQAPFGFVAILGVIALSGMIMRNSVILVEQIDSDIAAGVPARDAVIDATVRRSRPVILTAATAVLAMIPLVHSVFWGPMAIAIMGGLVAATLLTLVMVPALYAAWFGVDRDSTTRSTDGAEPAVAAR
jgi:multidrug efflux pump subunit AcrB